MSDSSGGDLVVTVNGKDAGLAPLLTRMEQLGRQADTVLTTAAKRMGESIGSGATKANAPLTQLERTSAQVNREVIAVGQTFARGAAGVRDYGTAAQILEATLERLDGASVQQEQALRNQIAQYQRLAETSRATAAEQSKLSEFTSSFKSGLTSIVAPVAVATAALDAAKAGVQSFVDAFNFKANLDATTTSIRLQLQGVRDSAQVFAESRAFGEQYKFTQEEMTASIVASIPILRNSQASFTDLAGVMARLQVLAPGKTFQEVASSVKQLQSGDYAPFADALNVSLADAKGLRDQLNDGKDIVQVLNGYLLDSGIGMDALAARTTGAVGKMNELKLAQEDMKLAQAEWAQGPGLAILNTQINATRGATRLLSGDFKDAGQSISANLSGLGTYLGTLATTGNTQQAAAAAAQVLAQGLGMVAPAADQASASTGAAGGAWMTAAEAAQQAARAADEAAAKDLLAKANADILSEANDRLADRAMGSAQAVLNGGGDIEGETARLAASSSQVDQLTAAYIRLMQAQGAAAQAAGRARLAGQAANTQTLAQVGFNAPGRSGSGDVDAVLRQMQQNTRETEQAAQAQRAYQEQIGGAAVELQNLQADLANATVGSAAYFEALRNIDRVQDQMAKSAKGGGGKLSAAEKEQKALLKGQTDYQNKSLDAAREFEEAQGKIAEDGARKRAEAEDKYNLQRKRGTVSFYQSLAGMENQDLARTLSDRYEAAAAQAQEIARTKGADAAQAYLSAQREAIQAEGDLEGQIADLRSTKGKDKGQIANDKNKADYLAGLLKMQQDADAEELRQVQAQGSQLAAEEEQQYREAELRYEQHLNEMGLAYQRKFGTTAPGLAPPPPTGGTAAASAPAATTGTGGAATAGAGSASSGAATLVSDPATQAAIDSGLARVEGKLGELGDKVDRVEQRVGSVERAVNGLKGSGMGGR